MPPQTFVAFLRAEPEKSRKAAVEKMRQRWALKPKPETKLPPKKAA